MQRRHEKALGPHAFLVLGPIALSYGLEGLVLSLVVVSIVVHGISVTPLMIRYEVWGQCRLVGE